MIEGRAGLLMSRPPVNRPMQSPAFFNGGLVCPPGKQKAPGQID